MQQGFFGHQSILVSAKMQQSMFHKILQPSLSPIMRNRIIKIALKFARCFWEMGLNIIQRLRPVLLLITRSTLGQLRHRLIFGKSLPVVIIKTPLPAPRLGPIHQHLKLLALRRIKIGLQKVLLACKIGFHFPPIQHKLRRIVVQQSNSIPHSRCRQSLYQPIVFRTIELKLRKPFITPSFHKLREIQGLALTGEVSHIQSTLLQRIRIKPHRSAMKHQFLLVKRVLLKKQRLLHHRHRLNPLREPIKQLMRKNQPKRCLEGRSHPKLTSVSVIGFVYRN